ncbi:uncharacterized protein PAC_10944 [Phialocephala subalpina]|uniref:Enoyl reductase (ER) domain-containing protein n=1 Tax=Phialocephala subalpina TaxID=576137 RepID=A0A1L7X7Q0_9HELO|nr:uncharacterized protein PAC_10944 [Phialocephala subalpina]
MSGFLGCLPCNSDGKKESGDGTLTPVIPVQYEIESKTLHLPSDTSFDSEPEFSKDEKTVTKKDPPWNEPSRNEAARSNRALVVAAKGAYALIDYEFPTLAYGKEVVTRNLATGLNPIDFKTVDYNFCLPEFPWVTGRGMAGAVEVVGEEGFKVGDRVWTRLGLGMGCKRKFTGTYYRERRAGCFQQFVTVPSHTVLHLPSNLSFDSAACLGIAALTAAMTLWRWLQVPMSPPSPQPTLTSVVEEKKEYLLIWRGSTVTGQFAIQIAKRCGLDVIAVTSAKTRSLAENLGAIVVVRDGKTEDEIVSELRRNGEDNIIRAIDLVATHTANFCLKAFSKDEGQKCLFAPLAMISSKAQVPENVTVETVEMKQFVLSKESRVYAVELNRLIEEGAIVLAGLEVLDGGLDVVVEGLEVEEGGYPENGG